MRVGWLLGGAATATAVVVAASVLVASPATRTPPAPARDGQPLLLAAAVVAEAQPATSGSYWHVKVVDHDGDQTYPMESWTAQDGATFVADGSGYVVNLIRGGQGFSVGVRHLTLSELEALPTDAAALTGLIGQTTDATAVSLAELLWSLPAPPAVRAAAFRALADLGNVTDLGERDGNWVLRIKFAELPPADKFADGVVPEGAGQMTLVIDPETSQLVSTTNFQGTIEVLQAEWTDDMPPVHIVTKPGQ